MKIGIDIHGVITSYPDIFSELSYRWIKKGYHVYILTGKEWKFGKQEVERLNIGYTGHFSIVDHHRSIQTSMEKNKNGWWMDQTAWDRSKGDFCRQEQITLLFENELQYAKWVPEDCTFVWVPEKGFENALHIFKSL